MKLAVCIPTHHGRRDLLEETLESIVAQVGPDLEDQVEVVVSDNASRDGTAEMIAALASRYPRVRLVYGRNERDLRLGNIARVVERATASWCWLFGSDDVMVDGALRRVLGTIGRHPDAAGVAVARVNFDHGLRERVAADVPEAAPAQHDVTVFRGFAQIEDELAFQHGFISTSVVRREQWLAAARDTFPRALVEHPDWPQLLVLGEMARRNPVWVWDPAVLVKVRAGRPYLVEGDGEHPNLARMHVLLVAGLRGAWSELAAGDPELRRRLLHRTYRVAANREAVHHIKLSGGHDLAWDLRLARAFVGACWRFPSFWREVAPLLLVPTRLYRAVDAFRRGRQTPMPVLEEDELRTTVDPVLPEHWWAREMPWVRCRVRNEGSRTLSTSGEHPVQLGARWRSPGGDVVLESLRTPLERPLAPGCEVMLDLRVLTPWEPGDYRLEIGLVQEGIRWFADARPGNGAAIDAAVELAGGG